MTLCYDLEQGIKCGGLSVSSHRWNWSWGPDDFWKCLGGMGDFGIGSIWYPRILRKMIKSLFPDHLHLPFPS